MCWRYHSRLVACLLVWVALLAAGWAQERPYPAVPPGIEYRYERTGDLPWAVYVVEIDRGRADFSFASTLARNTVYGLSPVSQQVAGISPCYTAARRKRDNG